MKHTDSSKQAAWRFLPAKITGLALLTIFLLLAVLSISALAQEPQDAVIIKYASHDGVTQGTTVTFVIELHNTRSFSKTAQVVDELPPELTYVPDSGRPQPAEDGNKLIFKVNLEPEQGMRLEYQAVVSQNAVCGQEIWNKAQVVNEQGQPIGEEAGARLRVICSDLGDAPTSDNHFNLKMFTPSGEAWYPTVYAPPSGGPSGPRHWRADLMHLGRKVSFERQADVGPDSDPVNNILPPLDTPDMDSGDDGWLDRPITNYPLADFSHCQTETLHFGVYLAPQTVTDIDAAYLNVWFDGNRSGKWEELNVCEIQGVQVEVPEHIVIDRPLNVVSLGAGYHVITVTTTVPVFNPEEYNSKPTWLRVSLSEQKSVKTGIFNDLTGKAMKFGDGRGPLNAPVTSEANVEVPGFWMGETEDYFYKKAQAPEDLLIKKRVDKPTAQFKDTLDYTLAVSNTNPFTQFVTIIDPIPPGTDFISGTLHASPSGNQGYDPLGNYLFWRGELSPNQRVVLNFQVKVKRCDPQVFHVINRARAIQPGAAPVTAKVETVINECTEPPPRRIIVRKFAPPVALAGGTFNYTLTAHNFFSDTIPVQVFDPLPFEVAVSTNTLPSGLKFTPPNLLLWETNIEAHKALTVTFPVEVRQRICDRRISNQLHWQSEMGLEGFSNMAWTDIFCSDLGDAPDSSYNHHGITNTAYILSHTTVLTPLVIGRFPTVWKSSVVDGVRPPSGPMHANASRIWLGGEVSYEAEADIGPDEDGPNNILAGNKDNSNNDRADDGWLNPQVPLPDCGEATLKVRISRNTLRPWPGKMYLNVWFDGNRDGDWADQKQCNDQSTAFEWIGKNIELDTSAWFTSAHREITLTTHLIMNEKPDGQAWARFTLSERPAITDTDKPGSLADGRGPRHPEYYRLGETEDYLIRGQGTITPGKASIDKTASVLTATVGQVYTYSVYLNNSDATPAHAEMLDPLPPEVKLAGQPRVIEISPGAHPLSATFDSSVGPEGAVGWRGELSPTAAIRIDFPVRVKYCPESADGKPSIYNKAELLPGGPFADKRVACKTPAPPDLTLRKFIINAAGQPKVEGVALAGQKVKYMLVFTGSASITRTFYISDALAAGTRAFTVAASSGAASIITGSRVVEWRGELGPALSRVEIRIGIELSDKLLCGSEIVNQAVWSIPFSPALNKPSNRTLLKIVCPDLGDAPDSSNHHGIVNTAYIISHTIVLTPLVDGRFPTVWQSPVVSGGIASPSGPMHADSARVWLGERVSYEVEADIGPDADGLNNILAGGKDNSNNDRADDGWLNPHVSLPDCRETTLKVRVFKNDSALDKMYLNVWFDGNRDGDWEDWKNCDDQRVAFEWIAHNFVVDMHTWPAGAYRDILVRTVLIENDKPEKQAWLRFTLSEVPTPVSDDDQAGGRHLADGRGPAYPGHYKLGETEDYLVKGQEQGGEPGQLGIDKTASVAATTVGGVYTYSVYLSHSGGTASAHAEMLDILPAEVKLAGAPVVSETSPSANPLIAYFNKGLGPNGAVGWRGDLTPGAAIRVDFPVRVIYCPPKNAAGKYLISNTARLLPDGPSASKTVEVDACKPPEKPDFTLTKRIITDLDEKMSEWTTVPGRAVKYQLILSGATSITRALHISDTLAPGVKLVSAHAPRGVARIINGGRGLVWDGRYGPASGPIKISVLVKLLEVDCGGEIVNRAFWSTRLYRGESNKTVLYLACHDLGDAPDSSNHAGKTMTAYGGTPPITATFPTVFSVAAPERGPRHTRPQPLHLGPRVSFEIEADIGLDLDGFNNILPGIDKANLDKADDGLKLDKLNFAHCQIAKFPVWVSIGPNAPSLLPQQNEGIAYLNLWLDSNRDGDWKDSLDCPPTTEGNTPEALEHIVIDWPVDVAALGPGLHKVMVSTNRPVYWPDIFLPGEVQPPAWLRVTLSDRKSNKTFACSSGANCYGDGRGYNEAFRLGETEDYLLRGPNQEGYPDPTVEKRGRIHPFFDYGRDVMVWGIDWFIHYKNAGNADSNNTQIVDSLSDAQRLVKRRSHPFVPPSVKDKVLTYTIGALTPGQAGSIFIHTAIPFTVAPGTVVTNTVVITGDGDGDPGNNRVVLTLTVPLLPPLITYPTAGTLCTGAFTITGRVQLPGAQIEVYINGALHDTVPSDASGKWSSAVSGLADGTYDIQARAIRGSAGSPLSPPVQVIVDSNVVWSPLSLRFITEDGHVMFPKDENGRMDGDGWYVFLRPGKTYTVATYVCCDDPNASVTLDIDKGLLAVTLTDDDGDRTYEATFTMPTGTLGFALQGAEIRLCITCYNTQFCAVGTVLIDPEGVVYDVGKGINSTGKPYELLSEATVACYEGQSDVDSGDATYSLWPADNFSQVNPQTTANDGYFSFFTPPGTFQLDVSREGYQPYRSWDIVVVNDPVEFNVPLTPEVSDTRLRALTASSVWTVTVSELGFEPATLTVDQGDIIVWVNIDGDPHSSVSITPSARLTNTGALTSAHGWDSGLLNGGDEYKRQLTAPGQYTYQDAENSAYTGLIIARSVGAENKIYLPLVLKD